jgi:regulatory protein
MAAVMGRMGRFSSGFFRVPMKWMMMRRPKPLAEDELHAYALKALAARALSTNEMRTKLERRALRKTDVDAVLRRLKDVGFLNDQRFADSYASWRMDQKLGRRRVERDLRSRKVAPQLVQSAVESAFAGADESAMLREHIARRTRRTGLPADRRAMASLYRHLMVAGFSPTLIFAELRRLRKEDADALEESLGE